MTDPTNVITTAGQAQVIARAMLQLAPNPADSVWQSLSEPILTVLLHRASPALEGAGLTGVEAALDALAEDNEGAASAIGISDRIQRQCLSRLDRMHPAQRESVIATIREAVRPWLVSWA
jgi:hypothetical protein